MDIKKRISTELKEDPYRDFFATLKLESVFFTQSKFSEPWGVEIPELDKFIMFHLIVSGSCELLLDNNNITLGAGDFVIFPQGKGHGIEGGKPEQRAHLSEMQLEQVTERYDTLTFGGGGDECNMICGCCILHHPIADRLQRILPEYMLITSDKKVLSESIRSLINLLSQETLHLGVGAEATMTRLTDVILIKSIREYLTSASSEHKKFLEALQDSRIGHALMLIHRNYAEELCVVTLAKSVGMSRTSFINKFKSLMGETPYHYLLKWRMAMATKRLLETNDSSLSIGLGLGYKSEPAFSRAFKQVTGKLPSQVRNKSSSNELSI